MLPIASGFPALGDPAGGARAGPDQGPAAVAGRGDLFCSAAGRQEQEKEEEEPAGVDALLDYVRASYGDRLSEENLAEIREGILGNLRAGARIRAVPLANSDGPGTLFKAYRGDGP